MNSAEGPVVRRCRPPAPPDEYEVGRESRGAAQHLFPSRACRLASFAEHVTSRRPSPAVRAPHPSSPYNEPSASRQRAALALSRTRPGRGRTLRRPAGASNLAAECRACERPISASGRSEGRDARRVTLLAASSLTRRRQARRTVRSGAKIRPARGHLAHVRLASSGRLPGAAQARRPGASYSVLR